MSLLSARISCAFNHSDFFINRTKNVILEYYSIIIQINETLYLTFDRFESIFCAQKRMFFKLYDAEKYSMKIDILLEDPSVIDIRLVGVTNREQLPRSNLYIFFRPIFVIKEWPLVEERSKRKASERHSRRH